MPSSRALLGGTGYDAAIPEDGVYALSVTFMADLSNSVLSFYIVPEDFTGDPVLLGKALGQATGTYTINLRFNVDPGLYHVEVVQENGEFVEPIFPLDGQSYQIQINDFATLA